MLRIMNMQQIGRHYYNPDDPFNIPQHRFGNQSFVCVCFATERKIEHGIYLFAG